MSTVSSATSTTATQVSNAAASQSSLTSSYDTFLTLLTTQLKNQSPDDPMDTNQMTQQLVQFSSVEQQVSMNKNLETLISLQQTSQLTSAAPMLGQTVEVSSDQLSLQNGTAQLKLPAAGQAQSAHVTVTNSVGRTLYEEDVALGSSSQTWSWNGKNSSGVQQSDGTYTVGVSGVDASGQAATVDYSVLARATGLQRDGTTLNLVSGSTSYDFSNVVSVNTTN